MDFLDRPVGRLPDESLLSVFRHLPVHIVYGSGEQEHPTGVIAVCKRWFTVVIKKEGGWHLDGGVSGGLPRLVGTWPRLQRGVGLHCVQPEPY